MAFLQVNFFSDVLGMCTSMYVILPQKTRGMIGINPADGTCYEGYPTLYLLHGMSDDHTIWMRRTSIERYADEAGIAVVMPTTHLGWYTDMKCGYNYRKFIGEELVQICRSFFPGMSKRREDTYLSGNSMGGYGSLAIALSYPETFSAAAPLSAAFYPLELAEGSDNKNYWTDIFGTAEEFSGSENDLEYMSKKLAENASGIPNPPVLPKIYMWCGTEDFLLEKNRAFCEFLKKENVPVVYEEGPGSHNMQFWDAKLEPAIKWMLN